MAKILAPLFALALFLFGVCAPAQAAETKYYVPPGQFNAAVQVMDQGFANVIGLFQNATGAFSFDPDTQTISRLKLAVDAASLMSARPSAGADLLALFEADKFPEITFVSTAPATFKDGKASIEVTLSIHGQSKPVKLEATLNQVGKSAAAAGLWDKEGAAVGLSLRTSIARADHGMADPPEIPGRFGPTLTILLDVQGLAQ